MTQRKNNISFLFLFCLMFCISACSQEYYSVNNFGKLTLHNDSSFCFHYWDCGVDSGFYKIKEDTFFFTSNIPAVKFMRINDYKESNYHFNFVSWVEIFDSNGCFKKKKLSKIDTLKNDVKIDSIEFEKGQVLNFSIFGMSRKLLWNTDTIHSCYFEIDLRYGRRIYFENYPLLIRDDYLLPFDEEANEYFRKINGFEFLPMKKGKKNQKYKTYMSGFGPIY